MNGETPERPGDGDGDGGRDGGRDGGGDTGRDGGGAQDTGFSWSATAKVLLSAGAGAGLVVAGNTIDAALGRFFEVLPLWVVALLLAAALGLVLGAWAIEHWKPHLSADRFRELAGAVRSRRILRRSWVRRAGLGAAFLLGITLGVAIWPRLSASVYDAALDAGWADCPAPVQLRVLTAPEQLPAVSGLAREFETADAAGALGGCYRADVTVYPAGVGLDRLAGAFSSNWREQDRPPSLGPRPDVWIPGSSADVDLVLRGLDVAVRPGPSGRAAYRTRVDGEYVAFERFGPVATSPLVVAVPAQPGSGPAAPDRIGRSPIQQPVGELLDVLRGTGARLAVPDALTSSAGLLHTVGLHQARYPLSALSAPPGVPLGGGDSGLLCWYRENGPDRAGRTALLVSERALAGYDAGRPLGGGCATPVPPAAVAPLLPYYLRGNPALDLPFVALAWRGQRSYLEGGAPCAGVAADQRRAGPDDRRRQAVCRLFGWLTGPGQSTLDGYGLRRVDGTWPEDYPDRSPVLSAYPGRLGDPPVAAPVLAARHAVNLAERARRVLVAFDVSATMSHPAPGGGSRLAAGAGGVVPVLNRIRPKDSLLVWRFAAHLGPDRRQVGYLPAGGHPYDAQHIAAVDGVKRRISAAVRAEPGNQNAAVFGVVSAAFAALRAQPLDPAAREVVVLVTDGQNEAELAAAARRPLPEPGSGRRTRLVVLMADGAGQCGRTPAGRALRDVARRWGGDCVDDPAKLADVVTSG